MELVLSLFNILKSLMKIILSYFLFTVNLLLFAQEGFIIENATVFDGDQVLEQTNVTVINGQITAVGEAPDGNYIRIDATGKFLMPGMTNSHVHAFNPLSLKEAARAGVLNVLDMHGMEPMQGYMKAQKELPGVARMYVAGYAATAPEGHGTQYGFEVPTLTGPDDAVSWVEDRVAAGVDHIKIIIEPWKNTLSHQTVKAIIDAAHTHNKVVGVHVSRASDGYKALVSGANGLVHLWWDQPLDDDALSHIEQLEGVFVTPTILTTILIHQKVMNKTVQEVANTKTLMLTEVKRLFDSGVVILAGTDPPNAGINMGDDLYKEMAYLKKAGLSGLDVLKTATSNPARMFGLPQVGYIKPGYTADLLLLSKNPIEDIENLNSLEMIWKAGVAVQR